MPANFISEPALTASVEDKDRSVQGCRVTQPQGIRAKTPTGRLIRDLSHKGDDGDQQAKDDKKSEANLVKPEEYRCPRPVQQHLRHPKTKGCRIKALGYCHPPTCNRNQDVDQCPCGSKQPVRWGKPRFGQGLIPFTRLDRQAYGKANAQDNNKEDDQRRVVGG